MAEHVVTGDVGSHEGRPRPVQPASAPPPASPVARRREAVQPRSQGLRRPGRSWPGIAAKEQSGTWDIRAGIETCSVSATSITPELIEEHPTRSAPSCGGPRRRVGCQAGPRMPPAQRGYLTVGDMGSELNSPLVT